MNPRLLHTYSAERQTIASELIDFDREWAKLLSDPLISSDDPGSQGADPAEVQRYFIRHGRYTAGTATKYARSVICAEPAYQNLAAGFVIGMRFHSAPVVRLADAKLMHLGHIVKADGRWRIFAFAGNEDRCAGSSAIRELCEFLHEDSNSPVRKYTRPGHDIDSVIDVRAVFQQCHRDLNLADMPALLLPKKGRFGLTDYEKMFCAKFTHGEDIFDLRRIDRMSGCMVLVRPDQYVAHILPLSSTSELAKFFDGFMTEGD